MQNVKRREKRENQPRLLTRRRIIENSYARLNRRARDYRLEASKVVCVCVCVCCRLPAEKRLSDQSCEAAVAARKSTPLIPFTCVARGLMGMRALLGHRHESY